MEICLSGRGIPCNLVQLQNSVVTTSNEQDTFNPEGKDGNNTKRKRIYRSYTYELYGYLDKLRRIVLPKSVMAGIPEIWSDKYGLYMRFRL